MKGLLHAVSFGFGRVRRSPGLVLVVLVVNLGLAALLAVPLSAKLRASLEHREAASTMLYGFDASWWGSWAQQQTGFAKSFGPDILGVGFAFRNLELLLKGELPLRLFRFTAPRESDEEAGEDLDPLILGLGAVYLLAQAFLTGGILGVFRAASGAWTVRGLLHGSGFYFGRLFRVGLVALCAVGLVFALNAPLARFVDHAAREAVSETTALAWAFGRHLLLLAALLFVNMLSGYAKVMIVVEERSSAVLAFLSSLGFCLRHPGRTVGHYLAIVLAGLVLLLAFSRLDAAGTTTGYRTQLLTFLLLEAFVAARLALRLSLLAGQLALYSEEDAG